MGLLDFIFGKAPEWEEVSKDTFSTEDTYIYSKGESKKLLKLYLGKLGFSKEDIRDEVEFYTEAMQDEELTDQQKEKEKFKSDGWKPYLIKYINDRVESEANRQKNPTLALAHSKNSNPRVADLRTLMNGLAGRIAEAGGN